MMGHASGDQNTLYYDICLEDYVPKKHLLRDIDRYLDLSALRQHLMPFYSHTGRPSVDPELMVRMLLIGYCFGIRSERRLCEEVQVNLAYRWFCRLGLDEAIPEHSTFSKNRHGRFRDSDAFRFVFEQIVRRAMVEGLVGAEGFAVDASVIKADANRQRGVPGDRDVDWSEAEQARRPIREYLDSLDACEPRKAPKNLSLTDPLAQWTAAPGGPAFYAYSTNYLVDIEAGIIVDVEATPAHRSQEVNATKTMIERAEERFSMKPKRLIGDTAYGTAEMVGWMVEEKAIEPHVSLWERYERDDGTFERSEFTFDPASNTYTCPGGKLLKQFRRNFKQSRSGITKANTMIYRASQLDCSSCAMKARCCPNVPFRKMIRSVHEPARDVVRRLRETAEYQQSRRDRKKVEMLFGHLKRILKLDRLRLRGMTGASDEFLLAATAQNLRRLALWLGHGPPEARTSASVH
jgi:transposase